MIHANTTVSMMTIFDIWQCNAIPVDSSVIKQQNVLVSVTQANNHHSRCMSPGPIEVRHEFNADLAGGFVGMGADKGKPALSRRAGACSSKHERKRLGVGEPVSLFLRDY